MDIVAQKNDDSNVYLMTWESPCDTVIIEENKIKSHLIVIIKIIITIYQVPTLCMQGFLLIIYRCCLYKVGIMRQQRLKNLSDLTIYYLIILLPLGNDESLRIK